jgi:uncharacterized membrane protein
MLLTGISLLGWVHTIACLIAILAGAYVLCARKGTRRHRLWGWWYAGSMAVLNISIMTVYRFDIRPGKPPQVGPHIFGIFHGMVLVTLAAVILAIFAASRQKRLLWAHVHAQAVLFSYYLLIGGLINEMFVRITALRSFAMTLSPHAGNPANTLLAREAQTATMTIWLVLVLWFAIKVTRGRAPKTVTIGYPLRYSGGLLAACSGIGIIVGGLLGSPGYGLIAGMAAGFIVARRAAAIVRPRWGRPSMSQLRVLIGVIGLEMTIFSLLGASGAFAHIAHAAMFEITLAIVGFHFLPMRWSHGPLMPLLGAAVLVWLGAGVTMHLPLPVIAAGDGLLKLGFGLAMAWPLMMAATRDASQSQYRQA